MWTMPPNPPDAASDERRSRLVRTEREPRRVAQGRGSWEEDVLERRLFLMRRSNYTTLAPWMH
jgi:hypothetical protein